MKDLLRKCPHHQVPKWQLVQSFYDGLSDKNRQMIDSSCGGTFMLKSEDEEWRLFDTLAENSLHHASSSHSDRATPSIQKKAGVLEIGPSTALQCKVDMIAQKLDQLLSGPSTTQQVCTLCASPAHEITECPSAAQYPEFVQEQVQAAQGYVRPPNNPFSSTYNPGWRNHPNFSWKNPQSSMQMPTSSQPARQPSFTQPFQRPSYSQSSSSSVLPPIQQESAPQTSFEERLLQAFQEVKTSNQNAFEKCSQILSSHTQSIAKLESQMGQLAEAISRRPEGTLPSQAVMNPKGKDQMTGGLFHTETQQQAKSVMALRSGREYHVESRERESRERIEEPETIVSPTSAQPSLSSPSPSSSSSLSSSSSSSSSVQKKDRSEPSHKEEEPAEYIPPPPYPKALESPGYRGKQGAKIQDMLDIFKHVQINLPLLDAIQQVPAYAKFLKELCTQKRKSRERVPNRVHLTEQVSSVLQHQTPPKLKDPGAPIIACTIGNIRIERALLDLGASVNILPGYFFDSFGLGEMRSTPITLQLADRSVKVPRGVLEDVLVKVDDFYFPVDFIILDMEGVDSQHQTPIILGRPFLATANACINCRTGAMDLSFGNRKVKLNIFNAAMGPAGDMDCFHVDIAHELLEEQPDLYITEDSLDLYHIEKNSGVDSVDVSRVSSERPPWGAIIEPLPPLAETPAKSSIESPPKLELKPLPDSLKYAYLGDDETLPVIIFVPAH